MSLVGRFDAHETDGFRRTVTPLLSDESPVLRVDLSQVAFVDSTALAELVRLQKAAKALGGEIILAQLSDPVRVILEITDLAGPVHDRGHATGDRGMRAPFDRRPGDRPARPEGHRSTHPTHSSADEAEVAAEVLRAAFQGYGQCSPS